MEPDSLAHIATPEEVLATFTELMRGDKSAERLKAAEQLAKYHSLFAPKEDAAEPSEAAAAVEAAVAEIMAAHHAEGGAGISADPPGAGSSSLWP